MASVYLFTFMSAYYVFNVVLIYTVVSMQDVHMPVMGGLEATQHIRRYEETINDTGRTQQGATAAINGPNDMSLRRRRRRIPIIAVRWSWRISIRVTHILIFNTPLHGCFVLTDCFSKYSADDGRCIDGQY